jgi:hypothetical protein
MDLFHPNWGLVDSSRYPKTLNWNTSNLLETITCSDIDKGYVWIKTFTWSDSGLLLSSTKWVLQ